MKTEIISLISFSLGAGTTLLSTYLTNKNQLKRDKGKYQNDLIIEDRKNEFELSNKYRIELLSDLERLNNLTGKIENSISLTSSLIESEKELTHINFDEKHQKELKDIIELKSLTISKFTEMYETVCKISGLHNQYWGNQRLLLMIDIKENREGYVTMQKEIILIARETEIEIKKIRNLSLVLAEKIRNKYIS